MIDDMTLERLLGDAADALDVPVDGPDRVLAARDAVSPVRRRDRRNVLQGIRRRPVRAAAVVFASLALVGVVAGVANGGGGSQVNSSAERSSTAGGSPSAPLLGAGTYTSAATGSAGAAGAAAPAPALAPTSGGAGAPNMVPGSSAAKVIKTGSMTLKVGSVESAMDDLIGLPGPLGGYVGAQTTTVPGEGQPASGDITLRVPEAAFDTLVREVRALGKPSQVTISGQDVTSQYADLKARLQALQSTIGQLQLIETKAQTIGDVLAVEQQISAQQTQADQIQGQINVLDDETTYGSLSVHIVEPQKTAAAVPPPSGISKAWGHARHSFAAGVEAVIASLGGIAVFLLFAAALLGLARLGWVALRRRLV